MSLNSLQDDMSRRAASMAAMAKRASNPQEIQAIQKSLVTGVQNGSIQPYVGIPLIQELTKKLTEAKAQMAQSMAGVGMQQAPQGQQAPQPPIAQQVMQQASQESQGLEALPSNLPQEYAGGGIIAFEEGGEVERYQNAGLVPNMSGLPAYSATNPNAAFGDFLKQLGVSTSEYANARPEAQKNILDMFRSASEAPKPMGASVTAPATPTAPATSGSYRAGQAVGQAVRGGAAGTGNFLSRGLMGMIGGPATGGLAALLTPSPIADDQAVLAALRGEGYRGQPYDVLNARKILESAGIDPNKAPVAPAVVNPTEARLATNTQVPPSAAPAAPVAPAAPAAPAIPGAGSFKPPTLGTYTPTAATMPVRADPVLTNLDAITKDFPKNQKAVVDTAVKASQKELEAMDRPGNEAREAKFGKREAEQEKNSAMGRALNLISLGLGVAGSKERSLAGALGKEGREGIQGLIQGEAASRAAKERLDDARDNFEQQKVQAKKGNYQAAQTAGREAGRDLLAATQFAYTSAAAGNAQGISMYNALSQSDVNKATVLNQAQQLNMGAVDQKNRNILGLAGLDLQKQQLVQTGALGRANLAAQEKRFNAMDDANKARIMQATAKGLNDFMQGEGAQIKQQLAQEYGSNFLTAQDARSLEGQRKYYQQRDAYLAIIKGQAIDALSARQADALLGQ